MPWRRLVGLKDQYQVAFANDPDSDRHGIVTPSAGLMNPNHYLAVAIQYLLTHRPKWPHGRCCRQDAGQQQHDRSRRAETWAQAVRDAGRLQVVCAGPVRRHRSASAARRARARASCGRTARCGRPTRTVRSWTCWRRKLRRVTGKDPGEHYQELTAEVRHAVLHAHRCAGHS